MRDDFAVFILSHKRADRIITYKKLLGAGYTGKLFILVDNEDDTIDEYRKRYGDKVIVFNKKEVAKTFDTGDNFGQLNSVTCARNACFGVARDLGIRYFMELDDDYTFFAYKFDNDYVYRQRNVLNIDAVIECLLDFFINTNILTITMFQGGDFIGGKKGGNGENIILKRKAMNSFICSVDRPFNFVGILNEDVNTYLTLGSRGNLLVSVNLISLGQKASTKNKGGITDLYLDRGIYQKPFTSVMFSPSCVKIGVLRSKHPRIHHLVSWNNAVPKIVSEAVRYG